MILKKELFIDLPIGELKKWTYFSSFVKSIIDNLNENELLELERFVNLSDEELLKLNKNFNSTKSNYK